MKYVSLEYIIAGIFFDVFSICVVISIVFLVILLAVALFYSLAKGSKYVAFYFGISIVMCVLRIISRLYETGFNIAETYYQGSEQFWDMMGIVNFLILIIIDTLINALLIGGILIITHSWFSTAIMLWFQRRDQMRRYLPSLFLFSFFVISQLIGLTLVILVAIFGIAFRWPYTFYVMELIHLVVHIVLYIIITATFMLLGALIWALLARLKDEKRTGTSTFKKGEMYRNNMLSRKIIILATAVALFFFIGAAMLGSRLFIQGYRLFVVMNEGSPNTILNFLWENDDYAVIYMLVCFYTLYIGIFEFGLTGFITIYYLLTPDEGLTQMPLLSEIERRTSDYRDFGEQENDFFDPEERIFHIIEDEKIKDMQINDEEEERVKGKVRKKGKKKNVSEDREELTYPLDL